MSHSSTTRFGYEWQKYPHMTSAYYRQFKNWVLPLTATDFAGKTVLDAGCGMGRNSYWALGWGVRELIAFDLDERCVDATKATLKQYSNAWVFKRSIYDFVMPKWFDIAMSIGVIHHLEHPIAALRNLCNELKPNGTLLIWVYSREGNERILWFLNPLRRLITSHLPLPLLNLLCYGASIPLWLGLKLVGRWLSLYLQQLSHFSLWHIHSIILDQLLPPIAHYWTQAEVEAMFKQLPLTSFKIYRPPDKQGWTIVGKK